MILIFFLTTNCELQTTMPFWLYDITLFFFLISVGLFLLEQLAFAHKKNKRVHRLFFMSALAISWMVIFYGSVIEPRALVVTKQTVTLAESPSQTLSIALLSDFHVGPYKGKEWVRHVVKKTNEQAPDFVLIAGDFVFYDPDDVEKLEPLANLKARFGVYAVTGNHDYSGHAPAYVIQTLERLGVVVLENEFLSFDVEGKPFMIVGISDIWFDGDPIASLYDVSMDETVILLTHNPDVLLLPLVDRADLVLAGHTHGGQIRLPWIGPVARVPTELGNALDKGFFHYNNQEVFITSGVSETGPRVRLFNPPEIALLSIHF